MTYDELQAAYDLAMSGSPEPDVMWFNIPNVGCVQCGPGEKLLVDGRPATDEQRAAFESWIQEAKRQA